MSDQPSDSGTHARSYLSVALSAALAVAGAGLGAYREALPPCDYATQQCVSPDANSAPSVAHRIVAAQAVDYPALAPVDRSVKQRHYG